MTAVERRRTVRSTLAWFDAPASWRTGAACRNMGPERWHPEREESAEAVAKLRAVCADCPARGACLRQGITELHGVWGGLSVEQRKTLRRHIADGCARGFRSAVDPYTDGELAALADRLVSQ